MMQHTEEDSFKECSTLQKIERTDAKMGGLSMGPPAVVPHRRIQPKVNPLPIPSVDDNDLLNSDIEEDELPKSDDYEAVEIDTNEDGSRSVVVDGVTYKLVAVQNESKSRFETSLKLFTLFVFIHYLFLFISQETGVKGVEATNKTVLGGEKDTNSYKKSREKGVGSVKTFFMTCFITQASASVEAPKQAVKTPDESGEKMETDEAKPSVGSNMGFGRDGFVRIGVRGNATKILVIPNKGKWVWIDSDDSKPVESQSSQEPFDSFTMEPTETKSRVFRENSEKVKKTKCTLSEVQKSQKTTSTSV